MGVQTGADTKWGVNSYGRAEATSWAGCLEGKTANWRDFGRDIIRNKVSIDRAQGAFNVLQPAQVFLVSRLGAIQQIWQRDLQMGGETFPWIAPSVSCEMARQGRVYSQFRHCRLLSSGL